MDDKFKSIRANGKTHSDVLCEFIQNQKPGAVITFEQLGQALSEGTEREFDRHAIRGIVCHSFRTVSKRLCRVLHSVRGIGYRVAEAGEHRRLAIERKQRSDRQLRKGLVTLENVRWEEMSEECRRAHEGQLLIVSSLVQMQRQFDSRLRKVEEAIRGSISGK